ncbi:MAG TPA: hypothetical protein PK987_03305 [Ferruginibacter sp.]|nr:hypothetical protein [Ferruginibacter sp.]
MIVIYIIIIGLSFLPLSIFFIKGTRYRKIIREGVKTIAEVKQVLRRRVYKGGNYDRVIFWYRPDGVRQYQVGEFISTAGKYRSGNNIDVYYLPQQPEKYAAPGSKYQIWILLFLLVLVAFVIYACIKIDEMIGDQKIYFKP